ncbi:MAG: FKBP-type peptidyl-prolyl cis-trans isomerase [Gemmatimonadales bacterium]|jgi:FKBP-type peptidyl-prolyl cis-trans isomerase
MRGTPRALVGVAVAATLVAGACAGGGPADLATFADSASYAIGMNMGRSTEQLGDDLSLDALLAGLTDAAEGQETALNPTEQRAVLQQLMSRLQTAQQAHAQEQIQANEQEGLEYRTENATREGVTTTESGLQYEVLESGSGPIPSAESRVRVHYRGMLVDGSEFESSYENEPVTFQLNEVIPGWTEGVQLMSVGSKYRFVIPPQLAYGDRAGPGGPNSTLIFEVELLEIVE